MAGRANWDFEDAQGLVRSIDAKLAPLGYHVSMDGRLGHAGKALALVVFPDVKKEDIERVHRSLADGCTCAKRDVPRCESLHLRAIPKNPRPKRWGSEPLRRLERWEIGRGKAARSVDLYYHELEPKRG